MNPKRVGFRSRTGPDFVVGSDTETERGGARFYLSPVSARRGPEIYPIHSKKPPRCNPSICNRSPPNAAAPSRTPLTPAPAQEPPSLRPTALSVCNDWVDYRRRRPTPGGEAFAYLFAGDERPPGEFSNCNLLFGYLMPTNF